MICELSTKAGRKDNLTAIMSEVFYSNLHQPRIIFIVDRLKKVKNLYSKTNFVPSPSQMEFHDLCSLLSNFL